MSGTVEGNIMTVTLNNYGNGFDAGTSGTFYIVVTGSGDFSVSTDMPSSSQAKKNSSAGLTAASQQIVTKKVKVKKAG